MILVNFGASPDKLDKCLRTKAPEVTTLKNGLGSLLLNHCYALAMNHIIYIVLQIIDELFSPSKRVYEKSVKNLNE